MQADVRGLAAEYAAALQDYVAGAGEVALQRAYELGRRALEGGLGVLDMAAVQYRALVQTLLRSPDPIDGPRALSAARKFFIESLSPFEMAHRSIQEAHSALRDSERRYRNLVETAPHLICTLALDGTITSLNVVFETMTGWSRAEWLGKDFAALVHPDDVAQLTTLCHEIGEADKPLISELRILSKSGPYISGEFVGTPQVRDGQVVGVHGLVRDITERQRADEAVRRIDQLQEEQAQRCAHALHAGQLLASVHMVLAEVIRELPDHTSRRLDQAAADLVRAIHEVCGGKTYVSPGISQAVAEAYLGKREGPAEPLTLREREVLQLVAEGKTTKEIAKILGISVKTAESHRTRIMRKVDIHETANLVRYAIRRGLIQP